MATTSIQLPSRAALLRPLQPLEAFVREYVEESGGVWEEIEPQVYDLLLDSHAVRITFDAEALLEHPSAQLASRGSPLMDELLDDARRRGAYTVLYADGLNFRPHDLRGRLRRAYTVPEQASLTPTSVRLCYFPQAVYGFVATFVSDRKEQAAMEVGLDLHSGREVRHLHRLEDQNRLAGEPPEALPEAPHLSVAAGFHSACQQVARSITPLANQRRRELAEHTGRQIDRVERYYARIREELDQQSQRQADPAEAAQRKKLRADAIERERQLRVAELKQKSILRAMLTLANVQIIHLPKLLVACDLVSPGGKSIALQAVYDLFTEQFEPVQLYSMTPTFDLRSFMSSATGQRSVTKSVHSRVSRR